MSRDKDRKKGVSSSNNLLSGKSIFFCSIAIWFYCIYGIIATELVKAQPVKISSNNNQVNTASSCSQDLERLTSSLLKDLPSYANRVIQKTQNLNRQAGNENYIVMAGKAEFEPLNLPSFQYNSPNNISNKQIFFTVLERKYSNQKIIEQQTYHWLFLTPTNQGWYLVALFSRFGNSQQKSPAVPPQETSNGIIGQAIKTWLRDCRAKSN